jgi:Ca2+-transporting ATPase
MEPLDQRGLNQADARKRLAEYGRNILFSREEVSFLQIARHEVTEPMILLLLVVGIFYSVWGRLGDAVTIFIVIAFLVLAEVYNEFRAKKAIASLEKVAAPKSRVRRDGAVVEIEREEIVPGDVLVVTPGTAVAADGEVIQQIGLQMDESALTGESFPQIRTEGERIYAGTTVLTGEGLVEVHATGRNTRLGEIAATLKTIKPPRTALQLAMKSLAGKLVFVAVFFSVLIPLIGIARGQDVRTMILTGLSLAFATIPEELPIIITMVLGLGAYTLSRRNFLLKRLKAAETLGNISVIVTDKTGTITENRMTLVSVFPEEKESEVVAKAAQTVSALSASPLEKEMAMRASGNGKDVAGDGILRQRQVGEEGRKTKAVVRHAPDGLELLVSGAPEEVAHLCENLPANFTNELEKQTNMGRRVIGLGERHLKPEEENTEWPGLERNLRFVGLLAFEDPPRPGVRETVLQAARAGVQTIMVTGDHPETARVIADQVGIEDGRVITGAELDRIGDGQMKRYVQDFSVFARTTPMHKYRIVKALQEQGEVVAVTGDGVNDVLALKGADVGIAMGRRGTDVARDAAEVVLADDNYVTIPRGIFEGRKFFDNLQKGIKYYLSVKFALILTFLIPVLANVPMPFSPIQIILLELFMDLAASAGFVAEPAERDIYLRGPRDVRKSVLSNRVILGILVSGFFLFGGVILSYGWARNMGFSTAQTQTAAFSAWIFGHIFLAYVSRSQTESVLKIGPFRNRIINIWAVAAIGFLIAAVYLPPLRAALHFAPIPPVYILAIALLMIVIMGLLDLGRRVGFARLYQPSYRMRRAED